MLDKAMRELDRAQTARRQLDASHPRPLMASEEIDGARYEVRQAASGQLEVDVVDLAPAPSAAAPVADPAVVEHAIDAQRWDRCTIL